MALGRILAAVTGKRRRWHVEIVRAGRDLNGRHRTPDTLRRAVAAFEGRPLKVLDLVTADGRRINDHQQVDRLVGLEALNVVGHLEDVRYDERAFAGVGGIVGVAVLMEGVAPADAIEQRLEALSENGGLSKSPIGLSFNGFGRVDERGFENIEAVDSVDFVTHPAAYGRVAHRLAASARSLPMKDLITLLTRLCASLVEGLPANVATDYALGKHLVERLKASADLKKTAVAALGLDAAAVEKDPLDPIMGWIGSQRETLAAEERAKASVAEATRIAAAEKAAKDAEGDEEIKRERARAKAAADEVEALASEGRLRAACAAARLPGKVSERLMAAYKGKVVSSDEAKKIASEKAREVDDMRTEEVAGRVEVVAEKRDRLTASLARMLSRRCEKPKDLDPDTAFLGSIHKFARDGFGVDFLEAARGDGERRRLRASIDATNFDDVFADALGRAFLAEYRGDPAITQPWRAIANIVPERDFREKTVIASTYYDELPVVAEGAPYVPLTTPSDRKESYTMQKRGGTEDITWERMLNDDLGLFQRMISRLGLTARETLNEAVFAKIRIATQPTMSDTAKLTSAAGARVTANLLTTALSADAAGWAAFIAAVSQMLSQTGGGGKAKGIKPRTLVIPLALVPAAGSLFSDFSAAATDIPTRRGLEILQAALPKVIVDLGTGNTKDWFLVSDPSEAEVVRVAFLGGREDPEVFIANNETFGSMFTNDQIVVKARHPYVVGVVDYAGIQGNDVA